MKKQTVTIGQQGSLINQIMGNNSTEPVVGQWVTILHYTDRTVAKVAEVSKDGKTVKIQHCETVADKTKECGMGHQNWIHTPVENYDTLVWRHGSWKIKDQMVVFTDEYQKFIDASEFRYRHTDYLKSIGKFDEIYNDHFAPVGIVDGITKVKTQYFKISVVFNRCNYYRDWEF